MKHKLFLLTLVSVVTLGFFSCNQNQMQNQSPDNTNDNVIKNDHILLKDYGPEPTVLDIESYTKGNDDFRNTLWTGKNLQVTLMTIPVNGDVGLEQHTNIDQFLRIEEGKARIMMGDTEDNLNFIKEAEADYAVFVPAGKWHNLVNIGDKPLKLYSIYAPAEHPHGTIHKTQAESMEAEHHH